MRIWLVDNRNWKIQNNFYDEENDSEQETDKSAQKEVSLPRVCGVTGHLNAH